MEPQPAAPQAVSPSFFERSPSAATQVEPPAQRRKLAFWSGVLAVPVAGALGAALGSRRAGLVAGGLAALGLGALRWQLARWFTPTPAYEPIARHGEVEVRSYPFRIEARTELLDATELEEAVDRGYGRLACYLFGVNAGDEVLPMATPVLTTMRDGVFATSFVLAPHRPMAALPRPTDMRVELREVPAKTIAAYRFRGSLTRQNLELQERQFLRGLVDAGLVARGSVTFASYDSPFTLPSLRRNELWIEIV